MKRMSVALTDQQYDHLKECADRYGVPVDQYLQVLLENFLQVLVETGELP